MFSYAYIPVGFSSYNNNNNNNVEYVRILIIYFKTQITLNKYARTAALNIQNPPILIIYALIFR